jgi:N-acetylglucosaminyl-diphospho-decaprenol L-rhamnosyltransferase
MSAELAIITVTRDSAHVLPRFLESTRRVAPRAPLIVVDNGSTDDTLALVRRIRPDALMLPQKRNLGFGRSCNEGARRADSRGLLFANPDVALTAVPAHAPGPGAGLIGPCRLAATCSPRAESGSCYMETSVLEDWVSAVLLRFVPPQVARSLRRRPRRPDWLSGALLLTRSDEFQRLGGFDPRFFLYYEDRDLAARYRRAGLPIRLSTELVGSHAAHSSTPDAGDWWRGAWALVSWFEYVAVWSGQGSAQLACAATRDAFAAALRMGRRWRGAPRVQRKLAEIDYIDDFLATLDTRLPDGDDTYYPCALAALEQTGWLR